ncbi:MAG: hypothetical protein GY796_21040 [Chloroflexi bacterium]|nr:hypothetical protein [Chloroflexota bacterium]
MNPFQSLPDYEAYIYTLQQQYSAIRSSTLTVYRHGARVALVKGEMHFRYGYRLVVHERLEFESGALRLVRYGYEIWQGQNKLYWYDPQPHPHIPELASTDPHHKHVSPDIKHNRIPAPDLSFTSPNLPFLIQEIEQLLCQ